MADGAALEMPGLDDMLRELRELPGVVRTKVLKDAVRAGATVILKEAIRLAPVYLGADAELAGHHASAIGKNHPPPGTLKRAIYQTRLSDLCTSTDEVWKVDVRRGKRARSTVRGKDTVNLDAYYASWVEYGHFTRVPHAMTKTARAAGRALGVARYVPAKPFMRPAAAKIPQALEAMRDYLAKRLPDVTAAMKYLRATGAP